MIENELREVLCPYNQAVREMGCMINEAPCPKRDLCNDQHYALLKIFEKYRLSEEDLIDVMTEEEMKVTPTGRDVSRRELARAIKKREREK